MVDAIEVSLLIPAKGAAHCLEDAIQEARTHLGRHHSGRYEIIVIPNPVGKEVLDESYGVAMEMAVRFPEVRVVPHELPAGKGAALKTGFNASSGRWILMIDADLPFDLEFFARAIPQLENGYGLVTGNRRIPQSRYQIPVSLLRLAYRRHWYGTRFNQITRAVFGLSSIDTQAGIKAMSRELARRAFHLQVCPGFFFDLELFLTARGHGFRRIELPVFHRLQHQKSTVRLFRDGLLAVYWLARLAWRHAQGVYTYTRGTRDHAQRASG